MFQKKPKLNDQEQIELLKKQKKELEEKLKITNEKKELEEEVKKLKNEQFQNTKLGKIVTKLKKVGSDITEEGKIIKQNQRKNRFYGDPIRKNNPQPFFDLEKEFSQEKKKNYKPFKW